MNKPPIDALVEFFFEDPNEETLMCSRCFAEIPVSDAEHWDGDGPFLCRKCWEADFDAEASLEARLME